jgi:putative copper resistance protein D
VTVTVAGLLQIGAALLLNAGLAWLIGSWLARRWLAAPPKRLDRSDTWAALACLAGGGLGLWAGAALMGAVDMRAALAMLPEMARQTAYGQAGLVTMLISSALLATPQRAWRLRAALLALFALARASVSHAGEHGLASVEVGLEWLHLVLICVWLGAVAVAAWVVRAHDARYLALLSRAATVALGGILATGVWNVVQRFGAPEQLLASPYGLALTVKLLLVGLAVLLGAYNRYQGFPAAAQGQGGTALLVLRIESLVLFGALAGAAVLTAQAPPA